MQYLIWKVKIFDNDNEILFFRSYKLIVSVWIIYRNSISNGWNTLCALKQQLVLQ